jgi:hypothetical protein
MSSTAKFVSVVAVLLLLGGIYAAFAVRGDTTIGVTITTNPDLNRGLVGHWTFDGPDVDWSSTTAEVKDTSGQGNDGDATTTMNADKSPTTGVIGQALYFDGANDVVADIPLTGLPASTDTISIAFWAKTDTVNDSSVMMAEPEDGDNRLNIHLPWNDGDLIYWDFGEMKCCGFPGRLSTSWDPSWTGQWAFWTFISEVGVGQKIYRNNVLIASDGDTSTFTKGTQTLEFSSTTTPDRFHGSIDDVRIYNRALSAEEVKRLYGLGNTTRVANTVKSNVTLDTGLVGHWTFDGPDMDWSSTTAEVKDTSGQGNDGNATTTMSAATSPSEGVIGQGMEFDGVNSYIETSQQDLYDGLNVGTMSFWFNTATSSPAHGMVMVSYNNLSNSVGAVMYWKINPEGTLKQFWKAPDGSWDGLTGTEILQSNTWYHFAAVADGTSKVKFYLNGQDDPNTFESTGSGADTDFIADIKAVGTETHVLSFGQQRRGSTIDNPYFGKIDDVRIYNRALSAEEVKRLYGLGNTTRIANTVKSNVTLDTGLVGHWTFDGPDVDWSSTTAEVKDTSGNGNNGDATTSMGVRSATVGAIGQGLRFDGSQDIVHLTTAITSGTTFTYSTWIYPEDQTQTYGNILTRVPANEGFWYRGSDAGSDAGKITLYYASTDHHNNTALTNRAWNHVVIVVSSGNATFYLNGSPDGTITSVPSIIYDVFGADNDSGAEAFKGRLDDLRFYNRALSAEEVQRLYNLGK